MGILQKLKKLLSRSKEPTTSPNEPVPPEAPVLVEAVKPPAPEPLPSSPTMSDGLKRVTGKRKPSDAANHRLDPRLISSKTGESAPSDYLYFGEGGRSPTSSGSANQYGRPRPPGGGGTQGASKTDYNPTAGKDDSGFPASGMRTQQAGYQNLTYGGSLQYDYSQTQHPN